MQGALSSEQAANNIAFISPQVTAHAHESSPSNGTGGVRLFYVAVAGHQPA